MKNGIPKGFEPLYTLLEALFIRVLVIPYTLLIIISYSF